MLNIKKVEDNKYTLTITEADGTIIEKDIDWAEMARLFCLVATEVCKRINKGE